MDAHTFRVLEFDRVRTFLAGCAASHGGRRLCLDAVPAIDSAEVCRLIDETSQMRREIETSGPLSLGSLHDIRPELQQSDLPNAALEPARLVRVGQMLETAEALQRAFSPDEPATQLLADICAAIVPQQELVRRISTSISPRGDILDTASPALSDIRRRMKKLRIGIIRELERHIDNVDTSYAIQDDFITVRNNRYVIPVRSDSKSVVPGVVHDQSQSRATLFVEPLGVVALNNDMQLLQKEHYYEEIRILTELTGMIHGHRQEIEVSLAAAERIDAVHARALFSRAIEGTAPCIDAGGALQLHRCRHPALLARFVPDESADSESTGADTDGRWEFDRPGVVPIDLCKDPDTDALVLTGANAGGKTVAMKTLGLLVLMAQCGMHLPAAPGATLPLYESVLADVGDEQNIEASLSTFSARMRRIRTILASAGPKSLVLLDELGSGTDPAEGGALAVAMLEFLQKTGCTTMVTTHLGLLKTYAFNHAGAINLSVAFDPETHQPTYRLTYGVPGISNAFETARAIGIPAEILQQAEALLHHSDQQASELIQGLARAGQKLESRQAHLVEMLAQAGRLVDSADALARTIRDRRAALLSDFEKEARRLLRQSESDLKQVIRHQKRLGAPGAAGIDSTRSRFEEISDHLRQRFPRQTRPEPAEPVTSLTPGEQVRLRTFNKIGTIVFCDDQTRRAEIDIGPLHVKTGYDELEHAGKPRRSPQRPVTPAPPAPVTAPQPGPQLTVIGMRVAEALPELDRAIDRSLLQGSDTLEIVHGRGTGRLMHAIHDHLKSHASVERFHRAADAQGGTGVTVAHLR